MPSKAINRKTQREIAALLSQAARVIAGSPEHASLTNLVENLQQQASELDSSQAEDIPAGRSVSLKYAHRQLCASSFLPGVRVVISAYLFYQGQPIWAISDDLQRVIFHTGETISDLTPDTRLERP